MGEIRHMAMCTKNNRRLARFYYYVFGLEEIWNEYQNSPYSFYIGDGFFQINCLQIRSGTSYAKMVNGKEVLPDVGMNHISFQVKNMKLIEARLGEWDPPIFLSDSPQDGRYEERRFTDPDANLFELAEGSWDAGRRIEFATVRYVGLRSGNPDRLADFYKSVLGMKEVRRVQLPETSFQTIYLSDGRISLGIYDAPAGKSPGLDDIGFGVENMKEIEHRIKNSPSFLYPGEPSIEILPPPSWSPYKSWKLCDPDQNSITISEEGWEI